MKTKNTTQSLAECLNFCKLNKLPPVLGEDNYNWLYGIALVLRQSLEEDYVIVKNGGNTLNCIRSYSSSTSFIRKYEKIYPFELYDVSAIPELKTAGEVADFLKLYFPKDSFTNEDGSYNKDRMKALIVKVTISEYLKAKKANNSKPISAIKVKQTIKKQTKNGEKKSQGQKKGAPTKAKEQ